MELIWPSMLGMFALIPIFVLFYIRLDRRRQAASAQFGAMGFASSASHLGVRRHVPPGLFLLALAILTFALARPEMIVSLPKLEGTVILAFDVSGSMAADDLDPTRMEAAKVAARAFVDSQTESVEIGVVSFSEGGLAVQVPTKDKAAVLAAIDRLSPQSGTSLGNGILAALNTIAIDDAGGDDPLQLSNLTPMPTPSPTPVPAGTYTSAVVVLLTDGENTSAPDPLEVAQTAADRGVRIHTVGIGSAAGTDLKIEGFTVHTALDEAGLQQIAALTGGSYYNAQSADDLLEIYDSLVPELVVEPEKLEITSLLAGASILLMLMSAGISMAWYSRLL
jgi:Ca-activated chloride channel homolog